MLSVAFDLYVYVFSVWVYIYNTCFIANFNVGRVFCDWVLCFFVLLNELLWYVKFSELRFSCLDS